VIQVTEYLKTDTFCTDLQKVCKYTTNEYQSTIFVIADSYLQETFSKFSLIRLLDLLDPNLYHM